MNAPAAFQLIKKYAKCGVCGNEHIGNGEGSLKCTDDTFERTCKCGWSVNVNEKDEPIGVKEDISAMRPGRKLDALVAEKVMGYVVDNRQGIDLTFCSVFKPQDGHIQQAQLFMPSIDVSAAWEVVEKLKSRMQILTYFENEDNFEDGWLVKIDGKHVEGVDTAPEAICKAALLAVMNTV